jgi:tRNA(Met) C34 N-acetyltransferase TmcA
MDNNNTNYVHILSETVVMGGISFYFYNKISEIESTIQDLKNQIMAQNNQIRYLISKGSNEDFKPKIIENTSKVECENGICYLKSPSQGQNTSENKKVSISKISKQLEFDRENMFNVQASKVNTFTNFSPNPVLQSVTPKPSESVEDDDIVRKILNDIDDE